LGSRRESTGRPPGVRARTRPCSPVSCYGTAPRRRLEPPCGPDPRAAQRGTPPLATPRRAGPCAAAAEPEALAPADAPPPASERSQEAGWSGAWSSSSFAPAETHVPNGVPFWPATLLLALALARRGRVARLPARVPWLSGTWAVRGFVGIRTGSANAGTADSASTALSAIVLVVKPMVSSYGDRATSRRQAPGFASPPRDGFACS
jgi:hypothetical protein